MAKYVENTLRIQNFGLRQVYVHHNSLQSWQKCKSMERSCEIIPSNMEGESELHIVQMKKQE